MIVGSMTREIEAYTSKPILAALADHTFIIAYLSVETWT